MPGKTNKLYKDMLEISQEYLGPASERFVNRQISMHLDKDPANITKEDVKALLKWIRPAMAHITHNQQLIDDFTNKLKALTNDTKQTKNRKQHVKFSAR